MTIGSRSLPRKCCATLTSTADCTEAVSASSTTRLGCWPVVPLEVSTLTTSGVRHAREGVGLEQGDGQEWNILEPLDAQPAGAPEHAIEHVAIRHAALGMMRA